MKLTFHITERGISIPGLATGELTLVQYRPREQLAVFYEAGSHYWAARGSQAYAPASFWVVSVSEIRWTAGSGFTLQGEKLTEFPVKLGAERRAEMQAEALEVMGRLPLDNSA